MDSNARCFCLSDGNLGFQAMAERYVRNWPEIIRAAEQPGPFLYSVRSDAIVRLQLG